MFQITLLFLYLTAAFAFAFSRLPRFAGNARLLASGAFFLLGIGVAIHSRLLFAAWQAGAPLTLTAAVSLIGAQLGIVALLAALNQNLRGLAAGLLLLAGICSLASIPVSSNGAAASLQIHIHVLTSMFAYGLLTVGAIVAIYALIQERRLRHAPLATGNQLFAPLETTEKLLFVLTAAGFTVLLLSVITGVTFVENLFAQHLVHKTTLSIGALVLFGVLLAGRQLAGWRGKRALSLYLAGFALLGLAYFGSRFILENLLGRSWG